MLRFAVQDFSRPARAAAMRAKQLASVVKYLTQDAIEQLKRLQAKEKHEAQQQHAQPLDDQSSMIRTLFWSNRLAHVSHIDRTQYDELRSAVDKELATAKT